MREHGEFCRSKIREGLSVRALISSLESEFGVKYSYRAVQEAASRLRRRAEKVMRRGVLKVGNWGADDVMREHGAYVRQCRALKGGWRTLKAGLDERGIQVSEFTCRRLVSMVDSQAGPAESVGVPEAEVGGGDCEEFGRLCYVAVEDLVAEYAFVLREMVFAGVEPQVMPWT